MVQNNVTSGDDRTMLKFWLGFVILFFYSTIYCKLVLGVGATQCYRFVEGEWGGVEQYQHWR